MPPLRLETSAPFVIQKHSRPADTHWDLMLQSGDCLATWRLDLPPEELKSNTANAIKIANHPLRFLTYQGPVNKGEGTVEIIVKGTYTLITEDDHRVRIALKSKELTGNFNLICQQNKSWILTPNNQ